VEEEDMEMEGEEVIEVIEMATEEIEGKEEEEGEEEGLMEVKEKEEVMENL
jgi:hypothetical protein